MEIGNILDYVNQLKDFIVNFFSFFYSAFDIFPSPINTIMRGFFLIIIAILVIKVVRG